MHTEFGISLAPQVNGCVPRSLRNFLRQDVSARIAAPLLGTFLAAEQLIYIPFQMVSCAIDGVITCDKEKIYNVARTPIAALVAAVAMPIIGLIGLVSPKKSFALLPAAIAYHDALLPRTPKAYTQLQARIMAVVDAAMAMIPSIASNFNNFVSHLFSFNLAFCHDLIKIPLFPLIPFLGINAAIFGEKEDLIDIGFPIRTAS